MQHLPLFPMTFFDASQFGPLVASLPHPSVPFSPALARSPCNMHPFPVDYPHAMRYTSSPHPWPHASRTQPRPIAALACRGTKCSHYSFRGHLPPFRFRQAAQALQAETKPCTQATSLSQIFRLSSLLRVLLAIRFAVVFSKNSAHKSGSDLLLGE